MHFSFRQKVMFRHCDPAGIVFFPKHFEMLNDAVEAMFASEIGWPFEEMHIDSGGPTVSLEAQFPAPARHGEMLDFNIKVENLGSTSLTLQTIASADGSVRFKSRHTMVCICGNGRPRQWPERVRERIVLLMNRDGPELPAPNSAEPPRR